MKCFEYKHCKKSKSKVYKYKCKKYGVGILDHLNGCINGEKK